MKRILCMVMVLALTLMAVACGVSAIEQADKPADIPTVEPKTVDEPAIEPEPLDAPKIVVFTDEVLEEMVRAQMNKPEGDITIAEAEAVESLDLKEQAPDSPSPRIKDISALEYFKNLKWLDLSYQNIEDLSPIAGLTQLEVLQIWGAGSIRDFSALSNLNNMLDLTIADGGGINFTNTDMQNLAGMTNIIMIWIKGAKSLDDISAVANFKNLHRLIVDDGGVSDLGPVADITTLEHIDIRGSKVSDISPLKSLVNLKQLFLEGCPITDYSPLKDIYSNLENKDFDLK